LRHRSNSGVTIEITGKMATASALVRMIRLPGKSKRAIAYAQNIARITEMNVAINAMPNELRSEGRKRSAAAPVRMDS
jgi:uncharacterized NAD-dependent epimerase/dehydratase family protein